MKYGNMIENVDKKKSKKRKEKYGSENVENKGEEIVRKIKNERINELKRMMKEEKEM
jgi:hypothetical protein